MLQLQEHFKATRSTETFFRKIFDQNLDSYIIPAYREPFQESGRGKGGLTQICKKSLYVNREKIKTKSWILQLEQYRII